MDALLGHLGPSHAETLFCPPAAKSASDAGEAHTDASSMHEDCDEEYQVGANKASGRIANLDCGEVCPLARTP